MNNLSLVDKYEVVIGLEVHCQLNTKTKLFCPCSTQFNAAANENTCPICLGHPGVLPVLNKQAVDYAVMFALAVKATLCETSNFSRKQYFYPDLPKGYQITQYDLPYCHGGQIQLSDGSVVSLIRAHLEEDAGKNIHAHDASYIDYNRAGIPLIEIVSQPVIHSPEQASDYLKSLRNIVRYLGISDGNLEEGSFRCDANVSLRKRGTKTLGTRCEIKNLNSFRHIEKAIQYEIIRQADILESGAVLKQQTLLFDAASGKTKVMRSKEDAEDYRYFYEPDLLTLKISPQRIKLLQSQIPELAHEKMIRYCDEFKISEDQARIILSDKDFSEYFEALQRQLHPHVAASQVAHWLTGEFLHAMQDQQREFSNPIVTVKHMAELLELLNQGVISGKIAKKVFRLMVEQQRGAQELVEEYNLVQITDSKAIEATLKELLEQYPQQVAEFKAGKTKLLGFFVGQAMKKGQGKFNPDIVNELLRKLLNDAS